MPRLEGCCAPPPPSPAILLSGTATRPPKDKKMVRASPLRIRMQAPSEGDGGGEHPRCGKKKQKMSERRVSEKKGFFNDIRCHRNRRARQDAAERRTKGAHAGGAGEPRALCFVFLRYVWRCDANSAGGRGADQSFEIAYRVALHLDQPDHHPSPLSPARRPANANTALTRAKPDTQR